MPMRSLVYILLGIILSGYSCSTNSESPVYKFDFGNGRIKSGYIKVTGDMFYTSERGFGFVSEKPVISINRKHSDPIQSDFCTSETPFYFVLDLPEGNYEIKIYFGDNEENTYTTVKAESRRLMLKDIFTQRGEFVAKTIMVNVRTPRIDSIESIRLKQRELVYLNWDDKLTLEFNGKRPCVNAIEIRERNDLPTMFLAGNSTVVDQEYEPWCSWGQMITTFLSPDIVVTNLAESGESLKSFQSEGRLKKLLSMIKPGDFVFIEFGHNDQKPQSSSYVEPFTGYKNELKKFIRLIRKKEATPVLVSSTQRRQFDENGNIINTHGDYPTAMKETAIEKNVPYIDLNAKSKLLFEALGVEGSKRAFVHYPAGSFPEQEKEFADNTHFSPYGAYELAKCVLMGIKENNLPLLKYINTDFQYDPSEPEPFEAFNIPRSPAIHLLKPDND